MIRREISVDTQPEVGQNIAGGVNQIAVFVLIYFHQFTQSQMLKNRSIEFSSVR